MSKILEIFWLVVAGVSLVFSIIYVNEEGFETAGYYFLFPLLALLMFMMRRFVRKRMEKGQGDSK